MKSYFSVLFLAIGIVLCDGISVTVRVEENKTIIVCKVSRLEFEVSFIDPFEREHAYCTQADPLPHCFNLFSDGYISQNIATNETLFELDSGNVRQLNGKWTCIHGVNNEKASIDVITSDGYETPDIQLSGQRICYEASNLTLSCSKHGGSPNFRFASWRHSINGVFVRFLNVTVVGENAFINIDQCKFQDAGLYACRLLSSDEGGENWITRNHKLEYSGSPKVINAAAKGGQNAFLSVIYYSSSPPKTPKWFENEELLTNSVQYLQTTTTVQKKVNVYGKEIEYDVYIARLNMEMDLFNLSFNDYHVLLANDYGNTTHLFRKENDKEVENSNTFHLSVLQWTLIGGCLPLVIVVISVLIRTVYRNSLSRNRRSVFLAPMPYEDRDNQTNVYAIPKTDSDDKMDSQALSDPHNTYEYEEIREHESAIF